MRKKPVKAVPWPKIAAVPVWTCTVFDKGTQVVWFELALDAIEGPVYPVTGYREIPVYPGSWMDFSILADKNATFEDVDGVVKRLSHGILRQYRFLYRYDGAGVPEGKVSYTFRFLLGLDNQTLTGDDLSGFHESCVAFFTGNGLSIR